MGRYALAWRFSAASLVKKRRLIAPAEFTPPAGVLAAAAAAFLTWARFVDRQVAAVKIRPVERFDRFLSLLRRAHGDERKAAGPAGGAIGHEVGFRDGAMRRKGVLQVVFGSVEGKVPHK
jgi:hypothetical protein